jgi:hypothetical protein
MRISSGRSFPWVGTHKTSEQLENGGGSAGEISERFSRFFATKSSTATDPPRKSRLTREFSIEMDFGVKKRRVGSKSSKPRGNRGFSAILVKKRLPEIDREKQAHLDLPWYH